MACEGFGEESRSGVLSGTYSIGRENFRVNLFDVSLEPLRSLSGLDPLRLPPGLHCAAPDGRRVSTRVVPVDSSNDDEVDGIGVSSVVGNETAEVLRCGSALLTDVLVEPFLSLGPPWRCE